MARELTWVADDEVAVFDTATRAFAVVVGLAPDTDVEVAGVAARTLAHPGGELLARIATVNDVHFGEVECGVIEGLELGPVLSVADGEEPYPEVMNRAVIADIAARDPDVVIAKGDLTTNGVVDEYERFVGCYGAAFTDRLVHVRGNHDAYHGADFAAFPMQERDLPGARLAVLDTAVPGHSTGAVTDEQIEWLDAIGAAADRPVLVFGHHHVWSPESKQRPQGYFGINPDDSERLVEVFARRPALAGYFAGHTHRNRVRRIPATGVVPWVEVACTKDFPGAWAEYRVYEGGVLQVVRRATAPDAVDWAERTRAMFGGMYADYAFGAMGDRCLQVC